MDVISIAIRGMAISAARKKAAAIPLIPLSEEVNELTAGIASNELLQRFIIWKAGEYQTIKQIEEVILNNNNNSQKLSEQLKALREQYFDWLVSIETDKFRTLESVGVPVSLANSNDSNRDGSLDDYSEEENQGQEIPGLD